MPCRLVPRSCIFLTRMQCLRLSILATLLVCGVARGQEADSWAASGSQRAARGPRLPAAPQTSTRLLLSGTLQSNAKGFDMHLAPTTTQMWSWWLYSPYSDVGVYFGGCNAFLEQFVIDGQPFPDPCGTNQRSQPNTKQANYNLNTNWLTSVGDQGWGVMPIWSGPQAADASGNPCVENYQKNPVWLMLTDGSTNGKIEADSAIARASSALGVTDAVIYYDMEAYNSTQCSAEVIAFLSDWTSELQQNGYKAGIYGSLGNVGDFSAIYPSPDAFWLSDYGFDGTDWNWQTASLSVISQYLNPLWTSTAWQYCSDGLVTCSGGNPPGDAWPPGSKALSIDGDVEDTLVLPYSGNRALQATNLVSPANGAAEQPVTPQFSWAPVQGAIQYSLAIAASISALPTGQQTSCSSCIYFSPSPITGTSYTLPSGYLQLGTTYYWEVQADSGVYKGGNWPSPYSFSTGNTATQIQSVSVNPSSFGSGSYTLVTVTINGVAPSGGASVQLQSSNQTAFPAPTNVTVLAGGTTASVAVRAGSVNSSTTVSVTALYNGSQSTTVIVLPSTIVVTTTAATGVTGSAAVLNGTVNPRGANGQYQFEWSTDPTLTTNVQTSCGILGYNCPTWIANSTTQAFNYPVSGLPSSTTYYFRLLTYDSDNGTNGSGAILSFITQ